MQYFGGGGSCGDGGEWKLLAKKEKKKRMISNLSALKKFQSLKLSLKSLFF